MKFEPTQCKACWTPINSAEEYACADGSSLKEDSITAYPICLECLEDLYRAHLITIRLIDGRRQELLPVGDTALIASSNGYRGGLDRINAVLNIINLSSKIRAEAERG